MTCVWHLNIISHNDEKMAMIITEIESTRETLTDISLEFVYEKCIFFLFLCVNNILIRLLFIDINTSSL